MQWSNCKKKITGGGVVGVWGPVANLHNDYKIGLIFKKVSI